MTARTVSTLVLMLLVTSCSSPLRLDRSYRMRSLDKVENASAYPLDKTPGTSAPPLQDLTAEQARAMALAGNETVAAAAATVEEARARILEAFSGFLPTISGEISRTANRESSEVTIAGGGSFVISPTYITQGSAAASMSLFAFGRDKASVEAARADLDVQIYNERTARQAILLQTTEAWYVVHNSISALQVARDAESAAKRQLEDATNIYDAGRSAKDQVLIARVNWLASKQDTLAAENNLKHAKRVLNVLLTRPVDAELTLAEPPVYKETILDGAQLVALGTHHNPGLASFRAARLALERRREAVALSLAPEIIGTLGAAYTNFRGFSGYSTNYFATIGVQFTPVDGGRRMSVAGQLHAQLAELTQLEQKALRELELDIMKLLLDIVVAEAQVEAARQGVVASAESYRIISDRFRNGKSTSRDVLEAQVTLSNSRDAFNLGRFGRQVYLARLEALVGVEISEWLKLKP